MENLVREAVVMPDAITDFENDYGNYSDRISFTNVTIHSSAVMSLIASNSCVSDSSISVLLGLIRGESTLTF